MREEPFPAIQLYLTTIYEKHVCNLNFCFRSILLCVVHHILFHQTRQGHRSSKPYFYDISIIVQGGLATPRQRCGETCFSPPPTIAVVAGVNIILPVGEFVSLRRYLCDWSSPPAQGSPEPNSPPKLLRMARLCTRPFLYPVRTAYPALVGCVAFLEALISARVPALQCPGSTAPVPTMSHWHHWD